MLKPFAFLTTLIFLSLCFEKRASAQTEIEKYLSVRSLNFQPYNFFAEKRFLFTYPPADTLSVQINNASELQKVVDAGLKDRVYGINIINARRPDLDSIFKVAALLPKLVYLKIQDPLFENASQTIYDLPTSVELLTHLGGIELFYTNKLNLEGAITKIALLKNLTRLVISGYKYPLPASVLGLDGITTVQLNSENITDLDLSAVKWTTVYLDGTAPNFGADEKALDKLSQISNLTKLDAQYLALNDYSVIEKLKQLKTLRLAFASPGKDKKLFSRLTSFSNLQNLSVSFNRDTTQRLDDLEKLKNLRSLNMTDCGSLATYPDDLLKIGSLEQLEYLLLNRNNFTTLPDIFGNLKHLKTVNLSSNGIKQLPASLFSLPVLENLDISNNRLTGFPQTTATLYKLLTLNASVNRIEKIPSLISGLVNLQKINLSSNHLSDLNTDWQKLSHLKEVDLKLNRLTSLPQGLLQIQSLEKLDADDNRIESIPTLGAGNFQLKTLSLNRNDIRILPEDIGNYKKLEILNLSGNRLSDLPESTGNLKELKSLNISSSVLKMTYDGTKNIRELYGAARDSSRQNNVKHLPSGLKDAKGLHELILADNPSLDGQSVFNVILSTPRKRLRINLSGDNIYAIPADSRWAAMTFYDLDLSRNKISTLPIDFTRVHFDYQIDLTRNLLKTKTGIYNHQIRSKGDLYLLYEEISLPVSTSTISKREYAAALTSAINDYYYASQWAKAVEYAQKALAADSEVYNKNVRRDEIGTARYNLGDYEGAIKDFDKFLPAQTKGPVRIMNFITPIEKYKTNALLKLGRTEEAANTYADFGHQFGEPANFLNAALLFRELGNSERSKILTDSALNWYSFSAAKYEKQKQISSSFLMDYAEVLIICGKPGMVAETLNKPVAFSKRDMPIKTYLIASANVLTHTKPFEESKKDLSEEITRDGKIQGWDYDLFNRWLAGALLPQNEKDQLQELRNIAK